MMVARLSASVITEIREFLNCPTPARWLENALDNIPILLIDHANCEKKAASTALNLIYRYDREVTLLHLMSRLAREELRHFEQVLDLMTQRGIEILPLTASRYAGELRKLIRTHEPARLVDTLIAGALIEARSCERFAALAPLLDPELERFYSSLLRSEGRHYRDYLRLAQNYAKNGEVEKRLQVFLAAEEALILSPDTEFRFHSGPLD